MTKNSLIKKCNAFLITLLGIMISTGPTYGGGHSSSSYAIPLDVLSSSGKNITSTAYNQSSTLGQPSAIGISISGSYANSAGYWPPVFSTSGGQAINFALSITIDPVNAGSVNALGITCPVDCTGAYNEDTPINLSASPTVGYEFDHWEGDCQF